jgi:hypothetical protein
VGELEDVGSVGSRSAKLGETDAEGRASESSMTSNSSREGRSSASGSIWMPAGEGEMERMTCSGLDEKQC